MLAAFNVELGKKDKEEEDDKEYLSKDPLVDIKEIRTVLATI